MRGVWNRVKGSDGRVPYHTTVRDGAHSYDFAVVAAGQMAKGPEFGVCSLFAEYEREPKTRDFLLAV
jgi:hypothetical protein